LKFEQDLTVVRTQILDYYFDLGVERILFGPRGLLLYLQTHFYNDADCYMMHLCLVCGGVDSVVEGTLLDHSILVVVEEASWVPLEGHGVLDDRDLP